MAESPPLIVVDTPWLLYRSFFGLPKAIRNDRGEPVNALLGTLNALLAILEWRTPRAVVCCFGAEDALYRVQRFPSYHAHRDPMPQALARQWEQAPGLLAAFGFHVAEHETLEADDLLYSFALQEAAAAAETLIVTADRDLFQAVGDHTRVLELRRNEPPGVIDAAEVRARAGVDPAQIPDLIALRGDPSDGIPGARGIGAKTAAVLLGEYGTLEGVLAAREQLRPALAATLAQQADELRMFREIATLVEVTVQRPADRRVDLLAGGAAASEYGLKRLAERLRA
jgi:DNA polymerase-1